MGKNSCRKSLTVYLCWLPAATVLLLFTVFGGRGGRGGFMIYNSELHACAFGHVLLLFHDWCHNLSSMLPGGGCRGLWRSLLACNVRWCELLLTRSYTVAAVYSQFAVCIAARAVAVDRIKIHINGPCTCKNTLNKTHCSCIRLVSIQWLHERKDSHIQIRPDMTKSSSYSLVAAASWMIRAVSCRERWKNKEKYGAPLTEKPNSAMGNGSSCLLIWQQV